MARRFRRLRRAASQVIEVTRRFWRYCHCCGTVRTGFRQDVIPVSVALSCTELPRAPAQVFCCHLHTKESAEVGYVSSEASKSMSIGLQNWIRPEFNIEQGEFSQRHQNWPSLYMPGSFSRDYQVTRDGISFTKNTAESRMIQRNSDHLPWRSPSQSCCAVPIPIWSVTSSGRRDDHATLRFLQEPSRVLNPVVRVDNDLGTSNNTSSDSLLSSSEIMKILDYEFAKSPGKNGSETSTIANSLTSYRTNMVPSLIPVEVSYTSTPLDIGFVPRQSGSSITIIPSPSSKNNTHLLCSEPTHTIIHSVHSSTSPIHVLETPSDKTCRGVLGNQTSSSSSSFVVLDTELDTVAQQSISSAMSSDICSLAIGGANRSRCDLDHSASTNPLPGCSYADPEIRLNLTLLNDSSTGIVISPDILVDFSVKSDWYDMDPGNWHHKRTIARTNCGSVTLVFCDKFHEKYVLKALPDEGYQTEIEILHQCQSPFVAEMQAVLTQAEDKLLCMTYYDRLDLAHWLRKDKNRDFFTEKDATLICSYILAGLEFIHNKGYLHLDIKPANVLLCNKAYPVLGDFGSARSVEDTSGQFRRYTPSYASPEILRGETPTNQADLWSTACVFYEIVAGKAPYKGPTRHETELKILATATPDVSMLSLDAQHFVCYQLNSDKNNRLGVSFGAQEVMTHRIFHAMDWDRIKYSHRHSDCRLLRVLEAIDQKDTEPSQSSSSSVCVNNNSSRWQLWSSSTSEGSDVGLGFSRRALYTLEEEDEDCGESERPPDQDEDVKVDNYGGADEPRHVDKMDDGGVG